MASNAPPNLTVSTSLSTVSSLSFVTTLKEFYVALALTPPAKAENVAMDEVKQAVNEVLAPVQMHWDQLDPHKQAKISFLYLRRQHTLLLQRNTPLDAAQMVLDSLDETNFYGKRLNAFLRKGGDIVVQDDGKHAIPCPFENFVRCHPEWLEEDDPTIFNNPDDFKRVSKPLLWLQEETSTVCYLVSIACAIFYSQCMHTGVTTSDDTAIAVGRYALNVSRLMRDEFTDEEVFASIFLGQGGHPDAMIQRILQPKNPGVRVMRHMYLHMDCPVNFIFELMKNTIREFGALVVQRFKTFVGFDEDNEELIFHGHWNEKDTLPANQNPNHALLIIGVRKTSSIEVMGGLAFLVQNSSARKPIMIIGLDLLRSMGVEEVLVVEPGLNVDLEGWNHGTVSPALIQSGSPRMFDDIEARSPEAAETTSHHRYWQRIDLETISHKIT